MLTAIHQNGESIANPRTASAIAVGVHQCADGQFDVRDRGGVRLTGPFKFQEAAISAARMLSLSAGLVDAVNGLTDELRSAMVDESYMRCDECGELSPQSTFGWACQKCMGFEGADLINARPQ